MMARGIWHSTERRQPQPSLPDTCSATTSGHDGRNPRPVLLAIGRTFTRHTVCDGCREVYESMGLPMTPERRAH